MRTTLAALSLAAGLGLALCQNAAAVPASPDSILQAAAAASGIEHTQYAQRPIRHGIKKCYREFVLGKYGCHRYHF